MPHGYCIHIWRNLHRLLKIFTVDRCQLDLSHYHEESSPHHITEHRIRVKHTYHNGVRQPRLHL